MRILLTVTLIMFTLWFAGCAAQGNDAAPPDRTWTRSVEGTCEGSRDVLWKAVEKALSGYTLKQRDPAAGMAVTGWKSKIAPHDMLGPSGAVLVNNGRTDGTPEVVRTQARTLVVNFEIKRRLTVSLMEEAGGKTRVSVTQQMYVTYFEGPKGTLKPEVYERLRGDFDTEEEVNRVLKSILDSASGNGK